MIIISDHDADDSALGGSSLNFACLASTVTVLRVATTQAILSRHGVPAVAVARHCQCPRRRRGQDRPLAS